MTRLKSHNSVQSLSENQKTVTECFPFLFEALAFCLLRIEMLLDGEGGLVVVIWTVQYQSTTLLRWQFGPMWTEDALYCERIGLIHFRPGI